MGSKVSASRAWGALGLRDLRIFLGAYLGSFLARHVVQTALQWHVTLLVAPDDRGLALGAFGLFRALPLLSLALPAGLLADRVDRRRILLIAQLAVATLTLLLGVVTLSGGEPIGLLYAVSLLSAAALAFDLPARHALMASLLPAEHVGHGASLFGLTVELAAIVGPALAGVGLATLDGDRSACGALYVGASVVFVLVALLLRRIKPIAAPPVAAGAPALSMLDGLRFMWTEPRLRGAALIDLVAQFFGAALSLLPLFATDILHVGAVGYGWLVAAPALGGGLMGLFLAGTAERIEARGRVLVLAIVGYGLATVVYGASTHFALTMLALAAAGAFDTLSTVLRIMLRTALTPDHLRGRATSASMLFFVGGPQLGELETGLMTRWVGPVATVISGGFLCLAGTAAVAFTHRPLLRWRREDPTDKPS